MPLRLRKETKETILQRVNFDYEFGQAERRNHESDWSDARKLFDSQWTELEMEQEDDDEEQYIFVPKTDMVISRILCAINDHFFPRGRLKLAKILGNDGAPQTVSIAAMLADIVLHAVLDRGAHPEQTLPHQWEAGLVEGLGWAKMGWTPRNTFDLNYLPNEHIVFDPYALIDRDIRWVIHEMWMTADDLWKRQRAGIFNNVKDVLDSGDQSKQDEWRQSITGSSNEQRNLYKILEFWGPMQLKGDAALDKMRKRGRYSDELDMVVTVFEDRVLLRAEPNTYANFSDNPSPFAKLPFSKCSPMPRRGVPADGCPCYGKSAVLRMRPLQLEINTMRNQAILVAEAEMTRKTFYDQNRLTNLEQLWEAKYMGPVGVDGDPRDVIMSVAPQASTLNLENAERVVGLDLEDLMGVTKYHLGGTAEGMQKTATGVSIVTSEGSVKMETVLLRVAMSSALRVAEFALDCAVRFLPHDKIRSMVGGAVDPEVLGIILGEGTRGGLHRILENDFHVDIEAGASATSREIELRKLQSAMQSLAPFVQIDPEFVVPASRRILTKMLKTLNLGELAVDEQSTPISPVQSGQQEPPEGGGGMEMPLVGGQSRPGTPQEMRQR